MTRGKALVDLTSVDTFRDLMTARDVSVRDLADKADVSPALISHLRSHDRTRRVGIDRAERIAAALEVDPHDLFHVPEWRALAAYAGGPSTPATTDGSE